MADEPDRDVEHSDDEQERENRRMIELLQELRVALVGVQVMFAFLLSLSFTERFGRIDETQRWTYVVTLLLSVLTAGLLVAPAAVHRMTFRRGLKSETVMMGHWLFSAGLVSLALTLTGAALLVLDVAAGRGFAVPVAVLVAILLLGLWFVLPLPLVRNGNGNHDGNGTTRDDP